MQYFKRLLVQKEDMSGEKVCMVTLYNLTCMFALHTWNIAQNVRLEVKYAVFTSVWR